MVRTLANRTIGTGPTLQVKTGNPETDNIIERGFARWSKAVKLAKKMHTMRVARCRDGEVFGLLTTNPALPGTVKLDLHVVEADQIYSPGFQLENATHCDGIDYDAHGNPTWYYLAKAHPGDAATTRRCRERRRQTRWFS
jgi:capsid protein